MTKPPNLNAAYGLGKAEDHKRLYADWAETYDATFIDAHQYKMPGHIADAFVALGVTGRALDVGVGTGVAGECLDARFTGDLDGLDISPEMLAVAQRKAIYDQLIEGDLTLRLDIPDETYDAILSAGTFTLGHLGPDVLPELLRIAKPGAWFVIGINQQHYDQANFQIFFDDLAQQITPITKTSHRLYASGAPGDHADDLGWVCIFRKTD